MIKALYTKPIPFDDNALTAPVWQTAEAYPLCLPRDVRRNAPAEQGDVRFAWNEAYLYVGFRFSDSDVVAEAERDQMRLWELGDVAELFIGPSEQLYYWEMHVAPNGRKMALFLPGPGRRGLPSAMNTPLLDSLQVAAHVKGALNDWHQRDEGWTALMSVPVATLTAQGDSFGPGTRWRVLAARYNYSRFLPELELSSHPQLSKTSFHMPHEFAEMELVK